MTSADRDTGIAARMADVVDGCTTQVRRGAIPFAAAVVAADGTVVGRGINRVRELRDPTAHAEVQAIRDACRTVGVPALHGMTLLASGEPCALCYLCTRLAGLAEVCYAADRDEAAAHGFDYRAGYALLADDPRRWTSPAVRHVPVPSRLEPFLSWHRRAAIP